MRIPILVLALSLTVTLPAAVAAQFPAELTPGTRIRVRVPERSETAGQEHQWVYGDVTSVTSDTLYVRGGAEAVPIAIPRATIQRIDRSLGVRTPMSCWRAGPALALGLAAVGFLLGTTGEFGAPQAAFILGVFWGGVINAISRTECWRRVYPP